MKTVSITEARRQLDTLARSAEPVELTRRGQRIGTLRGEAEAPVDRAGAMQAARDIRELSDKLAARRKPSKKHGATQLVRDLRDHGR